jgi:alkaline phosphatase D
VFGHLSVLGIPLGVDSWDGYPKNREKILSFIEENDIQDIVFLTGEYVNYHMLIAKSL